MADENRNLTDEDVKALASAIRNEMIHEFYQDLGHGFLGFVKKGLMYGLMMIAAYGAMRGFHSVGLDDGGR
jgi:hypothetical protein